MNEGISIEARAGLRNSFAGKAKEVAGTVTGNNWLTADGQAQQMEATAQREADAQMAAADIRAAAADATDTESTGLARQLASAGAGAGGALDAAAVAGSASGRAGRVDYAPTELGGSSAGTEPRWPAAVVDEVLLPAPRPPEVAAPLPRSRQPEQIVGRDRSAGNVADRPQPGAVEKPRPAVAAARLLQSAPTRTVQRWAAIGLLIWYGETRSALVRSPAAERRDR